MRKGKSNLKNILNFCSLILLVMVLSNRAFADTRDLFIEGGSVDIDSGGTIERFISGMTGFAGNMRLKASFHVDSGIGEFEKLRLEILKGSQSIYTTSCYSIHSPSDRTPKCDMNIDITDAISDVQGNYVLRIKNNSGKRIKSFNIRKLGFDILIPDYKSTFVEDCPPNVKLNMQGAAFSLNKDSSATRDITGVVRKEGRIEMQAKWHTATIIPNVFVTLKIELLRPNGTVARSGNFYSIHAPSDKTPSFRLAMGYTMTQADAGMTGNWRIRVTNNSNEKIEGFDIEKGSDGNPFVRDFKSIYRYGCD